MTTLQIPNSKSQDPASRTFPVEIRILGIGILVLGFGMIASGCAPRLLSLPTDPGTPLPDFVQIHRQATAACAGVRTLTAELSLSGRAGGRTLRGRAIAGFERPGSLRLEGVAPFGAPGFILAGGGDGATLLLPRDNLVLRNGRAEEILGALTGVGLAPAELQAILTGCVASMPGADGRAFAPTRVGVDRSTRGCHALPGAGWLPVATARGAAARLADRISGVAGRISTGGAATLRGPGRRR